MTTGDWASGAHVARLVRQCLEEGKTVIIDGLGVFRPHGKRGYRFVAHRSPKVFVAYVLEDAAAVDRLCDQLKENGFDAWVDHRRLLPGQNWPRAIESAIETTDFFLACFSRNSVTKKGGFHAEIRYALDCARQLPMDEVFLIPLRLDDCPIPARIRRELQYVDLFPDWRRGFQRIVAIIQRELRKRSRAA